MTFMWRIKETKKVSMIEEREGCYAFWKWRTRSIILNLWLLVWLRFNLNSFALGQTKHRKKIGDLQWLNPDESKQTNITWKIIYSTHLFLWDSIDVIARIILDWFKLRSIYRFIFNLKKKKNQRNIQIHPVLWRSLQVQNVHSFISLYVLWTKQLTLIYVRERKKIR